MPSILEWLLVFAVAATPMFELLFAIPMGVAMGVSPWLVAPLALAGNLLITALPCVLHERLRRSGWQPPGMKRRRRAARIFDRWGLPGLALTAPILTGTPLAAVIALAFGIGAGRTLRVIALGLLLWTPPTVLVSVGAWEGLQAWWP